MLFIDGSLHLGNQLWVLFLRGMLHVLLPLSVLVTLEHLRHVVAYAWLRLKQRGGRRAVDAFPRAILPRDFAEPKAWPKVCIQLPIFNERAVCQALVDCACNMEWPGTRICVQVLDDSTDARTRQLVDERVACWRERGVVVAALRRTHRQGYKAGALKQGMDELRGGGWAYVAVFDADFRPEPDFLLRTVPYLEGSADVAYVQARWEHANANESYLTKCQEVALNFHFRCEQLVHFAGGSFFNFNGTAGVWRAEAVCAVGGWYSRTTVEDMDLSLRTYLAGWRAVFLEDVGVLSEVPSSLFAYRKQQHRWTTGPAQLMLKMLPDIAASGLPLRRKAELLACYFGAGKLATHAVCLGLYCLLLPMTVFTPEVNIPVWALLYMPLTVTLCTCAFTPRGWQWSILFVLFQNAMGLVKGWAVLAGMLGLRHANEWVVTTKTGAAGCGASNGTTHIGITAYLFMQAGAFLAFGLNLVDHGGSLGQPLAGAGSHKSPTGADKDAHPGLLGKVAAIRLHATSGSIGGGISLMAEP